jgi:hypothetical protein
MNSVQKRKKIIEDTKRLQAQEATVADKKHGKGSKAGKDKKDAKSRPPKSQRPKWQNIIDDDEDDRNAEHESAKGQDDLGRRGSTE